MIAGTAALWLAFILGLCFGSFLNVVIFRLPLGQSLTHPPSRCMACGYALRWWDNVPILSWALLGGKCRSCRAPISMQYPIVELVTALLFVLVIWLTPPGPLVVSRLIFVSILITLFGIDLEHQILPNTITLPGIAIGFIFSFITPPGWQASLIGALIGAGMLYGVAAAYYFVRREEGLGMGDVKMLAMIGAFLGWQAVLVTLLFASVSGTIVGVGLLAARRLGWRVPLAFGTFLALGAVAAMFIADPFIAWYLHIMEMFWDFVFSLF